MELKNKINLLLVLFRVSASLCESLRVSASLCESLLLVLLRDCGWLLDHEFLQISHSQLWQNSNTKSFQKQFVLLWHLLIAFYSELPFTILLSCWMNWKFFWNYCTSISINGIEFKPSIHSLWAVHVHIQKPCVIS